MVQRPPRDLSTWNPWYELNTNRKGYQLGSATFPPEQLPTNTFWASNYSIHGELPIRKPQQPPAVPLFGGLMGSLVNRFVPVGGGTQSTNMGIGRTLSPPLLGYCLGEKYFELQYFYLLAYYIGTGVGITLSNAVFQPDLLTRARFKRLHVSNGLVVSFSSITDGNYLLTIDGDFSHVSEDNRDAVSGDQITIYSDHTFAQTLTVVKITEDGEIEVSAASDEIIVKSGDFFALKDKAVWCLEDPYLMAGYYLGYEDEDWPDSENSPAVNVGNSGYNFYRSSSNRPYFKMKMIGQYVFIEKDGAEETSDDLPTPAYGASMGDTDAGTWAWLKFDENEVKRWGKNSRVWGIDKVRYKERVEFTAEEEADREVDSEGEYIGPDYYRDVKREYADSSQISSWDEDETISYFRLELEIGGSATSANWHSPILERCFIKQSNSWFKILGQPESNIVDVSKLDVTGEDTFDTESEFEIFNDYAWMINEAYGDSSYTPWDQGRVDESTMDYDEETDITKFTVNVERGASNALIANNLSRRIFAPEYLNHNSFYNRFRHELPEDSDAPTKLWTKYSTWKVRDNETQKTYGIETIEYDEDIESDNGRYTVDGEAIGFAIHREYNYDVSVRGNAESVVLCNVVFDTPYVTKTRNYGGLLTGEMNTLNDKLWMNYEYRSAPMSVKLPKNLVVGVCGGKYWGLATTNLNEDTQQDFDDEDASVMQLGDEASSINGINMWVTTPGEEPTCLSGVWNNIRYEDMLLYRDLDTRKLTIREGTLNFRNDPQKIEVSFGPSELVSLGNFSQLEEIELDGELYDRVRLLRFDVPDAVSSNYGSALTFRQGGTDQFAGFIVSGRGEVDFQALRALGNDPGDVDSSEFMRGDYVISPLYTYMRARNVQELRRITVPFGMSATDGPIYIGNGAVTDLEVEYIKDSQTLGDAKLYDMYRLEDGEVITVYSRRVGDFKLEDGTEVEASAWSINEGIFVLGSPDSGRRWITPTSQNLEEWDDDRYQKPIMIMNACVFLGSIFDPLKNLLSIFYEAEYDEDTGAKYIGCYQMPVLTLASESNLAEENITGEEFLIRPMRLTDSDETDYTVDDNSLTITHDSNEDVFSKIMGDESVDDVSIEIEGDPDLGTPSFRKLDNGVYVCLYNEESAIRMLFSRDGGVVWKKSDITLAEGGIAPFAITDGLFVYITEAGIVSKNYPEIGLQFATQVYQDHDDLDMDEGDYDDFREDIQEAFDALEVIPIGSGQVDAQRMAGYQDAQGNYKLFYYDSEGALTSSESNTGTDWKVAPNF